MAKTGKNRRSQTAAPGEKPPASEGSPAPLSPPLLNRELSWIAFNERVLEEAQDERWPLLERLKFVDPGIEVIMMTAFETTETIRKALQLRACDYVNEPFDVARMREIVDRETRAWDTQDVDLLLSVFHPDMVWPWPRTYTSVDPVDWRLVLGRFDEERWRRFFEEHFAAHELVHNRRSLAKIEVSAEGDGAPAVVDIDTLWRARSTDAGGGS